MMNSRFSIFSVGLVFIAVLTLSLRYSSSVITWDSAGYYYYLPALFIHHDITGQDVTWMEDARVKYDFSGSLYQLHKVKEQENFLPQYSSGMAFMYAPGFFIGHVFAHLTGSEKDGFSPPYQYAMFVWSLCIVIFALLLLRKFLLFFYSDKIAAWTILLIGLATNYLIQTAGGITTAHTYIFLLYVIILYSTYQWVHTTDNKWLFALAVTIGLACLSRPSEVVSVFIPLLYGLGDRNLWRKKWSLLFRWKPLLISILLGVLMVLPQFVFWKLTTGHWYYMSYSNPGEGFDFNAPHTFDFLFSYRKGWFVYTPLMLLAFFGFIFIYKKYRAWFWPLLIFSIANIYFLSSWSAWWYAQCFSQRSMVQSLPVMAFLLAALLIGLQTSRIRVFGFVIISMAALLTMSFEWQYDRGLLSQDRMTRQYFWKMIGRTSMDPEMDKLLLVERSFTGEMIFDDYENYLLKEELIQPNKELHFSDSLQIDSLIYPVLHLHADRPFSKSFKRTFSDWTGMDHFWMQVESEVFVPDSVDSSELRIVCCAEHQDQLYAYFTRSLSDMPDQGGDWKTLRMDYLSPEVRKPEDEIKTYLWWRGQGSVYAKNIRVKIWEKKG